MTRGRVAAIIAWWLWIPVLCILFWGAFKLIAPGMGEFEQGMRLWVQTNFLPNGLDPSHFTPWTWLYVVVGLIGTAIIATMDGDGGEVGTLVATGAVIAAIVTLIFPVTVAVWDGDKDGGRYYSSATTFHLPPKTPASTQWLFKNRKGDPVKLRTENGCQVPVHDVKTCVKVSDTLFAPDWEGRSASLSGALRATGKSASPLQKVDVMEESATYLYGEAADTGVWSTILDGSEWRQPAYGVALWDGKEQNAQVCAFRDGYKFNRAFGGGSMNNLGNLIAEKFPDLLFETTDVWGYCAGGQATIAERYPVFVIPVQRAVPFEVQTVRTAAGVLVLKGSPSGNPVMEYKPVVKAGEFPGPVYPLSLVAAQRTATEWAAGREYKNRTSFGYEPATDEVQAGNASEFLLRDRANRRLWYVTPATPNGSASQAILAYALTPADQVTNERLNPLDVRVYADNHLNIVNFNDMLTTAQEFLGTNYPGMISSGLKLTEFTPLTDDVWRLFGEIKGLTVMYFDISFSGKAQTKVVSLRNPTAPTEPTKPDVAVTVPGQKAEAAGCSDDPKKMSEKELMDCAAAYLGEMRERAGKTPAAR